MSGHLYHFFQAVLELYEQMYEDGKKSLPAQGTIHSLVWLENRIQNGSYSCKMHIRLIYKTLNS